MIGVFANGVGILIGALIGVFFNKHIKENVTSLMISALALCSGLMGVEMALDGGSFLVLIIVAAMGAWIGELLRIEQGMKRVGDKVQDFLLKGKTVESAQKPSISMAFVTSTMLFCVGPMAILGSLSAGLEGDLSTLFFKTGLDTVAGIAYGAALGPGVLLSSICVIIYQGLLFLGASLLAPILSPEVIAEITKAGGVLLVALSIKVMGIKEIAVANLLPALFLPLIILPLLTYLGLA